MIKFIETADKSKTIFSEKYQQSYHSITEGAVFESYEKHILPAFKYLDTFIDDIEVIYILDICYGLGYNSLATILYLQNYYPDKKVVIYSPEFDKKLIQSLKDFDYPKDFISLKNIINKLSDNFSYQDNLLKIEIIIGDAREFIKKTDIKFHIIYQDAFSPTVNPFLWTREYFQELYNLTMKNSILTTYSISTSVKMGLVEAGFNVFTIEYETLKNKLKKSLIASKSDLDNLFKCKKFNLQEKLVNNPSAKSIKDDELVGL